MPTSRNILISLLFVTSFLRAQQLSGVYKIQNLLDRINHADTLYVVNFWALWCKPCIQELPSLDSLNKEVAGTAVKVLLVSVDFRDEDELKVNQFLVKHGIRSECVLLDEVNGNSYINLISTDWSGAIPATLFKKGDKKKLLEKKLNLQTLKVVLQEYSD